MFAEIALTLILVEDFAVHWHLRLFHKRGSFVGADRECGGASGAGLLLVLLELLILLKERLNIKIKCQRSNLKDLSRPLLINKLRAPMIHIPLINSNHVLTQHFTKLHQVSSLDIRFKRVHRLNRVCIRRHHNRSLNLLLLLVKPPVIPLQVFYNVTHVFHADEWFTLANFSVDFEVKFHLMGF